MTDIKSLPVAVIGAGPVGLAAAAHLIGRGHAREGLRGRRDGRRQRARLGPRAPVLAVGVQRRRRRQRSPEAARLAGAARRRLPDGRGPLRGLSAAARGDAGDEGRRRDGHPRHGDHPARHRQGDEPGPRDAPFVLSVVNGSRAPGSGAGGHRRVRHLDDAEPARRRRRSGRGRGRESRQDRLRDAGRPRARPRDL